MLTARSITQSLIQLRTTYPFITLLILGLASGLSSAHFQLIYTDQTMIVDKGSELMLKMPFTHPGSNGAVMSIDSPQAFYCISPKGKEDLSQNLRPIQWSSSINDGKAFEAKVSQRLMGDYVYIFQQSPYYDESQEGYIQQFAKLILNVGGLPTSWDTPQNLPIEILPLQMPYKVYAGGTFSGQVLANGKPVPNAEVEVELLNFKPNMKKNSFADKPTYQYPSDHFATISLKADRNGVFVFGIPKPGIWGFMAGFPESSSTYKDKPLSQEAILWVEALELK
jgi:cobalt/nickel transport protein